MKRHIMIGVFTGLMATSMAQGGGFYTTRHMSIMPNEMTQESGVMVSKEIGPGIMWSELVPSWDAEAPLGSALEFWVIHQGERFCMGRWSEDTSLSTSFDEQKQKFGRVLTDTFQTLAGEKVRFEVKMIPGPLGTMPKLNRLDAVFSAGVLSEKWDNRTVAPLNVPILAQGDFPNGGVICSPTSLTMIINYWSQKLERPTLQRNVPDVCAAVYDPAWKGTGNWAFNVGYAANLPGMTGRVGRLITLNKLQDWLEAGIPVACSVSYGLLKGKEKRDDNDGHLVVAVGVDANGDFIFNDPGKKPVRLVYKRDAFERAWAVSTNTCYLVYPTHWRTPNLP